MVWTLKMKTEVYIALKTESALKLEGFDRVGDIIHPTKYKNKTH